jgi:N-acetylmuramoyl-L-alanine amidase
MDLDGPAGKEPGTRRAPRRLHQRLVVGSVALLALGGAAAAATIFLAGGKHPGKQGSSDQAPTSLGAGATAPPESQSSARRLEGYTVAIDPGHNGRNYLHPARINRPVDAGTLKKPCDTTGTSTDRGYTEAAYNLDVGLRLADLLRRAGARVVLTRARNDGWGPCITARAAVGNRAHANAAISIHADGGPSGGRGFYVIYPPSIAGLTDDIAASSRLLALDVRAAFARGTGMSYATYVGHDGLDVRGDLGGLNLSDVPKVFIETGNMRSARDARLLMDPQFREREARALERGLETFLTRAS